MLNHQLVESYQIVFYMKLLKRILLPYFPDSEWLSKHWWHRLAKTLYCTTTSFAILILSIFIYIQIVKPAIGYVVCISDRRTPAINRLVREVRAIYPEYNDLVVTLLRGDRNPSRHQVMKRPEMIGQPQSHGRRPLVIAMEVIPTRQPQGPMRPMEVVIEQL